MATQEIKPLTSQYFSNLIKLESDFINKTYTAETLDELIEYYSQAVEYYDSIKDQIASYFIYKIQDTLAQKKSFKLLRSESTKLSTPKGNQTKDFFGKGSAPNSAASTEGGSPSPLRNHRVSFMGGIIAEQINENSDQSDNEEEQNDDEDEEDEMEVEDDEEGLSMAELRMRARNRTKDARKSIATLKKKTQKLFILQMKLQDEKASAKQTLNAIMDTFAQTSTNNDEIVANNLSKQRSNYRQRIQEKLAQRSPIGGVHAEIDFVDEGATGSTVFIDNGSNSPNLGAGLLHDSIEHGGSSL